MTMLMVTHQMGSVREVANRICFFDGGGIAEEEDPSETFFAAPRRQRTRDFLPAVLAAG